MRFRDVLKKVQDRLGSDVKEGGTFDPLKVRLAVKSCEANIAETCDCITAEYSFTTVADQIEYDLPVDFANIQYVNCDDVPCSQRGRKRNLTLYTSAQSVEFYIRDRKIGFYPAPATTGLTVNIIYWRRPPLYALEIWRYIDDSCNSVVLDVQGDKILLTLTFDTDPEDTFQFDYTAGSIVSDFTDWIDASTNGIYYELHSEATGDELCSNLERRSNLNIISNTTSPAPDNDLISDQRARLFFEMETPPEAHEAVIEGAVAECKYGDREYLVGAQTQSAFARKKESFRRWWAARGQKATPGKVTDHYGLGGDGGSGYQTPGGGWYIK